VLTYFSRMLKSSGVQESCRRLRGLFGTSVDLVTRGGLLAQWPFCFFPGL